MNAYENDLERMLTLQDGWDSYKGKPPSAAALEAALKLIDKHLRAVPLSTGGVSVQLYVEGLEMEIVIGYSGKIIEASLIVGLGEGNAWADD